MLSHRELWDYANSRWKIKAFCFFTCDDQRRCRISWNLHGWICINWKLNWIWRRTTVKSFWLYRNIEMEKLPSHMYDCSLFRIDFPLFCRLHLPPMELYVKNWTKNTRTTTFFQHRRNKECRKKLYDKHERVRERETCQLSYNCNKFLLKTS